MSHVARAIETVRAAAVRFKKKPLADRAEISDATLRYVHDATWNPCAQTLGKLEKAAADLVSEHGPAPRRRQREPRA